MTTGEAGATQAFRRDRELLDSQQHAGELAGWEQNYDQISRGSFRSRLVEIEFDDVQLFQEELSQAVFQTGQCGGDMIAFGVFSAMSSEARWHGGEIGLDDVLCIDGKCELVLSTPKTSCLLGMGFPKQRLAAWCGELPDAFDQRVKRLSLSPLRDQQTARHLRDTVIRLITELLHRPNDCLPGAVARQLHDELAQLVVELLYGDPRDRERRMTGRAKKVVQRARAFALERREEPPSLLEVCQHTFVSLRTLQNCFQTVLGESPATYLKMLRLNGARRELMQGGAETLISDIAANWGFWHLSQFSTDYRCMFGELPSTTRVANAADQA